LRNGKIFTLWNETVWISAKQNKTICNFAKQNETSWNVAKPNKTRWKLAKRNKILLVTKRSETKFREIYWFAKHAKFCRTYNEFRLVSCFAKLKKRAKLETLLHMQSSIYLMSVVLTWWPLGPRILLRRPLDSCLCNKKQWVIGIVKIFKAIIQSNISAGIWILLPCLKRNIIFM
jgi:hypothetical protein